MRNFPEAYCLYDMAMRFGTNVFEQDINIESPVFTASLSAIKGQGSLEEQLYMDMMKEKNFDININYILENKIKDPYLIYIFLRNCMQKNILNQQQFRKSLLVSYGNKVVAAIVSYDIINNFKSQFLFGGLPDLKSVHYYLRINNGHKYTLLKEENERKLYDFIREYI